MRQKILLTILGGWLCVSTLHAMPMEEEGLPRGVAYYSLFEDVMAAIKAINPTPEAKDNPNATIEDFRKARDTLLELAKLCLNDASMYSERATNRQDANLEDYQKAISIYQMSENKEMVDYYTSIIFPEK